jgi:hypothetical protein
MSEVRFDSFNDIDDPDEKPVERPESVQPAPVAEPTKKVSRKKKKWPVVVIIIVGTLIIAGLATLAVWQYQQNEWLKTPEGIAYVAQQESDDLVGKVSALIKLPDEEAVIATVDDKDKLREQPFFADVENGDKVLIFSTAGRAVIYRPSENRIINSGPIAITADEAETETQPAQ